MALASEAAAKVYVDNTFIAAGNYGTVNLPGSSGLIYKQGMPGSYIDAFGNAGLGPFTDSSKLPTQGTTFSGYYADVARPAVPGPGSVLYDTADPYLPFSYVNGGNTWRGHLRCFGRSGVHRLSGPRAGNVGASDRRRRHGWRRLAAAASDGFRPGLIRTPPRGGDSGPWFRASPPSSATPGSWCP